MIARTALALFALLPLLASAVPVGAETTKYKLISSGRDGGCLSLPGGISDTPYDGAPIVSVQCNIASAWDIDPSLTGSITLSGTSFALDIGDNPTNNGALKVWTSYPGIPAQTWTATNDNTVFNVASGQCLDEGDAGLQTYQCYDGNRNQKFYFSNKPGSPSTSPSPSVSSTTSPSSTPTSTPPTDDGGVEIHPSGNPDQCVTVQNGFTGVGARVAISSCMGAPGGGVNQFQAWVLPSGGRGQIKIKSGANDGSYLCLDAGDSPNNGSGMKVWTCYDGLLQQDWTYYGGSMPISLSNAQCLDVKAESTPVNSKPYGSLKDLQTWQCSKNGDPYQQFST